MSLTYSALAGGSLPLVPLGSPEFFLCVCSVPSVVSNSLQPHGLSPVHGILQARTLEWVAMPSSRRSSQSRNQTRISCFSCIAGRFFTPEPPGKSQFLPTSIQIYFFFYHIKKKKLSHFLFYHLISVFHLIEEICYSSNKPVYISN